MDVLAYLNHGIWKVDCPKCGKLGAALAEARPKISPYCAEGGEYVCPRCYPAMAQIAGNARGAARFDVSARMAAREMAAKAGEIYRVVFPPNKADIEKIVSIRPIENRNWTEPETMEFLASENKTHGVR